MKFGERSIVIIWQIILLGAAICASPFHLYASETRSQVQSRIDADQKELDRLNGLSDTQLERENSGCDSCRASGCSLSDIKKLYEFSEATSMESAFGSDASCVAIFNSSDFDRLASSCKHAVQSSRCVEIKTKILTDRIATNQSKVDALVNAGCTGDCRIGAAGSGVTIVETPQPSTLALIAPFALGTLNTYMYTNAMNNGINRQAGEYHEYVGATGADGVPPEPPRPFFQVAMGSPFTTCGAAPGSCFQNPQQYGYGNFFPPNGPMGAGPCNPAAGPCNGQGNGQGMPPYGPYAGGSCNPAAGPCLPQGGGQFPGYPSGGCAGGAGGSGSAIILPGANVGGGNMGGGCNGNGGQYNQYGQFIPGGPGGAPCGGGAGGQFGITIGTGGGGSPCYGGQMNGNYSYQAQLQAAYLQQQAQQAQLNYEVRMADLKRQQEIEAYRAQQAAVLQTQIAQSSLQLQNAQAQLAQLQAGSGGGGGGGGGGLNFGIYAGTGGSGGTGMGAYGPNGGLGGTGVGVFGDLSGGASASAGYSLGGQSGGLEIGLGALSISN